MKHLVWGILVLVYLGLIITFPTPTTFATLFLGCYKMSEIASKIGEWSAKKYKERQS